MTPLQIWLGIIAVPMLALVLIGEHYNLWARKKPRWIMNVAVIVWMVVWLRSC